MTLEEKDKYIEEQLMKLEPDTLRYMVADLHAEVEQLRVQLAGCGVAALCNTIESMERQRCERGGYGWSESYGDVIEAVKREIRYRDALEQIVEQPPEPAHIYEIADRIKLIAKVALER